MKDLMRELKASLSANKLDMKIEAAIEKLQAENAALKAELAAMREQKIVGWQWAGTAHFRRNIPKDAEKYAWTPLYAAPGAQPTTVSTGEL